MRGQSKPPPACSESRSKPCRRQSSCSVTTTAAMHTLPWICQRTVMWDKLASEHV